MEKHFEKLKRTLKKNASMSWLSTKLLENILFLRSCTQTNEKKTSNYSKYDPVRQIIQFKHSSK